MASSSSLGSTSQRKYYRPHLPLATKQQSTSTVLSRKTHQSTVCSSHSHSFHVQSFSSSAKIDTSATPTPESPSLSSPEATPRLKPSLYDKDKLFKGILNSDRRYLSRAITLIESSKPEHNQIANALLLDLLEHKAKNTARPAPFDVIPEVGKTLAEENEPYGKLLHNHAPLPPVLYHSNGKPRGPLRIGISGTPGVGKSTFIESFGMHLCDKYGLKVAVLSIDPSSLITGGSLLGDKTRMQNLSFHDSAYIRPSPSKGILGGIAQNTAESVLLCEAAGYDVVIVETVGVGQSEVTVSQVTDILLMLVGPGGGDELQGIKKGMMEMCDIMLINKADGDLLPAARRTRGEYAKAMHLFTTRAQSYGWSPRVMLSSVKEDKERYMDNVWAQVLDYEQVLLQPVRSLGDDVRSELKLDVEFTSSGEHVPIADSDMSILEARRANQRVQWMWSQLNQQLLSKMQRYAKLHEIGRIETDLIDDKITPRVAAERVFDSFLTSQLQLHADALKAGSPKDTKQ